MNVQGEAYVFEPAYSSELELPSERGHEEPIREPLRWFAEQMEARLRENDYKEGWLGEDDAWLLERLEGEAIELGEAMERGYQHDAVIHEAADVANFAMMIADQARAALDTAQGET